MSVPAATAKPAESFRWPLIALIAVILPQVLVPAQQRLGPPLIVPLVELALFLVLLAVAAIPGPVPPRARPWILWMFGLLIVANTLSAVRLVWVVLSGEPVDGVEPTAVRLLVSGLMVLATNTVTFALLYWQWDAGGPDARARVERAPDFGFPQTGQPDLAAPGWRPLFADYLFVAYTNVVAFSPTDTAPLSRTAKGLMTVQSLVSLSVLVVVLARVINILPTT